MPKKPPVKKAAKKRANPAQLTIDLPPADQLALNIQKELVKLPSQATHNHLHRLGEQAKTAREQLLGVEIVAPILCAIELEHQKVNHGLPWKEWVKQNCEFSYMTSTKYAKVLKCARAGMIKDLDPDLIPETAPSLMSAEQLQEACTTLADALQGYRGIRQLYLELEVIKTPQRNTMLENRTDNKNKKSSAKSSDTTASQQMSIDEKDAIDGMPEALKGLDDYLSLGNHQLLPKSKVQELDESLQSARDLLKPLLK